MDDSATDESDATRTLFQSAGDTITSATACKKEARRSVGERLKMRKSTPRPTTKGNGRKRFNASPSPSTKPESKKAFAEDDEGEGIRTSGFKKNLMEELDMVATSAKIQGSEDSHVRSKEKSPEEVTPTCKEMVLYSEHPKDGIGGEEGPLEVCNTETQVLELPDRLEPSNPDSTPALLVVGVDGAISDVEEDELQYYSPPSSPRSSITRPMGDNSDDVSIILYKGANNMGDNNDGVSSTLNKEKNMMESNLLLESGMLPYHDSCQRDDTSGNSPNQPKIDNIPQTTSLFESNLVASPHEGLHDSLAVEPYMQPKNDSLLQVVAPNVAESLDVMMAQPLLIIEPLVEAPPSGTIANSWPGKPDMTLMINDGANGPSFEDFPPLEKGPTRIIRDNFECGSRSMGVEGSSPGSSNNPMTNACMANAKGPKVSPGASNNSHVTNEHSGGPHTPNPGVHASSAATDALPTDGDANQSGKPKSMADVVRGKANVNGPQVFIPENIQTMGVATTSNGIPAIYFSGAENQKLATSLGNAIVGKFSHSIPSSFQIQKALDNIKFRRGFSWTYINAKHILVQFEDITDYARLLCGPKGTPMWYVDRHPMRVFKWSPDFDAYCESPIAAIWCNLIGLPIHLYDQSALFAIGKLLGTPIQVDRATANRSRLSFARICIEIDISKPPPEEIILDICGRTTVQQVKWDKIPSYCRECKHVGHKSEVCYASGKLERPPKRNYNSYASKATPNGGQLGKEKQGQMNHPNQVDQSSTPNGWKQQGKNKGSKPQRTNGYVVKGDGSMEWMGPDIMGELQGDHALFPSDSNEGGTDGGESSEPKPHGEEPFDTLMGYTSSRRGASISSRGGARGMARQATSRGRGGRGSSHLLSTNQYFSLMEEDNFVEEGDGDGWNGEVDTDLRHNPEDRANPSTTNGSDMSRTMEIHQHADRQGGPLRSSGTSSHL